MNTDEAAHDTGRQPSGTTAEKYEIFYREYNYLRTRRRRTMNFVDVVAIRPDDGTGYDDETQRVATNAVDGFMYLFCFFRTKGRDKKK